MLRVQEDPPALSTKEGHRVADHRQVLGKGCAQSGLDVTDMRLGHHRDHRRTRVDERPDLRVVCCHGARAPRGAERGERRIAQREIPLGPGEELGVLGVGTGPAALDETDTELVQVHRDGQLVLDREVQALLLRTIAQRGVVNVQVGHRLPCLALWLCSVSISMVGHDRLTARFARAGCGPGTKKTPQGVGGLRGGKEPRRASR